MGLRSALLVGACVAACRAGAEERNRVLHTGEPVKVAPLTLDQRFLAAIQRGDLSGAQALVGQGASSHARDAQGSSAVLLAARFGEDPALLRWTLAHAPEHLDTPDANGRTPLSFFAQRSRVAEMKVLIDRGAKVDRPDASGHGPLFYAVGAGSIAAMELLLARGAPVDARDTYGDTALSLASTQGNPAVVLRLLKAGADRSLKNQEGRTPLDRAANDEVRGLLRAP